MGETLDPLLRIVLHDVAATGAPEPTVEYTTWPTLPDHNDSAMLWAPDGSGTGVWVDVRLASSAEGLAQIADQVQEWVIEELARTLKPTNWPRCPDHPTTHPLTPLTQDGLAVWQCPTAALATIKIGTLSSTPG